MAIPFAALPFPRIQLFTSVGAVAASHRLAFYVPGTTTPLDTYADHLGVTPNANPLTLDAAGRATVYIAAKGYKAAFLPPAGNDTPIWTQDNVFDPGFYTFGRLGILLSDGSEDVASGYAVDDDDILVTVASTGGPDPCVITLPDATTRQQPVFIKNMGTIVVDVTPQAAQPIEGITAAYRIPVAATPLFPCVEFRPRPAGKWFITSSHGI